MTRIRRFAAATVALVAGLGAAPAATAAPSGTVSVDVAGARTARLTLAAPAYLKSVADSDRSATRYGFLLTKPGSDSYFVTVRAAVLGGAPMRAGARDGPDPDADNVYDLRRSGGWLYLHAGSYDLTVFSAERRRVRLAFDRRPSGLRFRTSSLDVRTLVAGTPSPVWRADADFTLREPGRGFAVFAEVTWEGAERMTLGTCAWRLAPCVAHDTYPLDRVGTLTVTRRSQWLMASYAARDAIPGTVHLAVEAVVTGTPIALVAVVIAVP